MWPFPAEGALPELYAALSLCCAAVLCCALASSTAPSPVLPPPHVSQLAEPGNELIPSLHPSLSKDCDLICGSHTAPFPPLPAPTLNRGHSPLCALYLPCFPLSPSCASMWFPCTPLSRVSWCLCATTCLPYVSSVSSVEPHAQSWACLFRVQYRYCPSWTTTRPPGLVSSRCSARKPLGRPCGPPGIQLWIPCAAPFLALCCERHVPSLASDFPHAALIMNPVKQSRLPSCPPPLVPPLTPCALAQSSLLQGCASFLSRSLLEWSVRCVSVCGVPLVVLGAPGQE